MSKRCRHRFDVSDTAHTGLMCSRCGVWWHDGDPHPDVTASRAAVDDLKSAVMDGVRGSWLYRRLTDKGTPK